MMLSLIPRVPVALYVAKYFPPETKAAADEMVRNIIAAMNRRIEALDWMTPETKAILTNREVIAIDLPGFGESPMPPAGTPACLSSKLSAVNPATPVGEAVHAMADASAAAVRHQSMTATAERRARPGNVHALRVRDADGADRAGAFHARIDLGFSGVLTNDVVVRQVEAGSPVKKKLFSWAVAAGKEKDAARLAGAARTRVGEELGLIAKDRFEFCWIVDFPMYEYDEESKKVDFSHNPFSMPQGGLEALETQAPLTIRAYQYDIVCNGYELCSGAIRNHLPEIMLRAFEIAAAEHQAIVVGMSARLHQGESALERVRAGRRDRAPGCGPVGGGDARLLLLGPSAGRGHRGTRDPQPHSQPDRTRHGA